MRRVLDGPFLCVVGTQSAALAEALMRSATQLARLWFEVAGGLTEIVRDVDLSVEEAAGRNLILFGGPEDNFFTSKVLATPDSSAEKADKSSKHPRRADGAAGELPLAFQQQSLILGPCAFDRRQHGLLSLLPWQSHRLALLLVPPRGANASSDVASGILRMPREVPGVPGRPSAAQAAIRSWQAVFRLFLAGLFKPNDWSHRLPDYVVLSSEVRPQPSMTWLSEGWRGLGDIAAAGFFDHQWRWRPEMSFELC